MAFSQATITDALEARDGADMVISWTSTSPDGTPFQVYVARQLIWHGTARSISIPWPATGQGNIPVDIGTVAPGEEETDFSGTFPALGWTDKASLTWAGGDFESDTILGFRVYGARIAGGPVDYTNLLDDVTAYQGGVVVDGWGVGGWGQGGWGESALNYTWKSGSYTTGSWTFGIKAVDQSGNLSTAREFTVALTAPPGPPTNVHIASYVPATHTVTIAWTPPA